MTIDQLIQIIENSTQHRYIYHFTDEANFPTIAQKGLLSKVRMREEGFWPSVTGGNQLSHQLDAERGIDRYVSLCFTQRHPMRYTAQVEGRLLNPRYLAIKPDALKISGAMISFDIANAASSVLIPLVDALERLDNEVIYQRTNWSDPEVQRRLRAAERYEILIPHHVPSDMIVGFY